MNRISDIGTSIALYRARDGLSPGADTRLRRRYPGILLQLGEFPLKTGAAWARRALGALRLQWPRNGMCMLKSYFQRLYADPNSTASLVRRLLTEQAAGQWRRYALAFGLMGIAAASTALGAYLIGDVINQAYVTRICPGSSSSPW